VKDIFENDKEFW